MLKMTWECSISVAPLQNNVSKYFSRVNIRTPLVRTISNCSPNSSWNEDCLALKRRGRLVEKKTARRKGLHLACVLVCARACIIMRSMRSFAFGRKDEQVIASGTWLLLCVPFGMFALCGVCYGSCCEEHDGMYVGRCCASPSVSVFRPNMLRSIPWHSASHVVKASERKPEGDRRERLLMGCHPPDQRSTTSNCRATAA